MSPVIIELSCRVTFPTSDLIKTRFLLTYKQLFRFVVDATYYAECYPDKHNKG
jgi:hypothetical protein